MISGAGRTRAKLLGAAIPALLVPWSSALAQTPVTRFACYVPTTGTVYMIKEPQTRSSCSGASHVQFSWVDGAGAVRTADAATGDLAGTFATPLVDGIQGRSVSATAPTDGQLLTWNAAASHWEPKSRPAGTSDHGALAGLTDDDHSQYLLASGMRKTNVCFAVSGTAGIGPLPATGPGGRIMYSTSANAFRVGSINAPFADGWDLPNLGAGSIAMGSNVVARGAGSIVLGSDAVANKSGSFLFAAGNSPLEPIFSDTKDEFRVHAAGGIVLSTGTFSTCRLNPGSGSFACSSDSTAKADFEDVQPEDVLQGVATIPITRWRYRGEPDTVRHMGPTAQDFRAAFDLGSGDRHIGLLDAAGVSLAAAKALAARTTALAESATAIRGDVRSLRDDVDRLRSERDDLRRRLDELETGLKRRTDAAGSHR